MFSRIVEESAAVDGEAVVTSAGATSWPELARRSARWARLHHELRCRRVGLPMAATADHFAMLAALDQLDVDVFLISADLSGTEIDERTSQFKLGALLRFDGEQFIASHFDGEDPGSGQSTVTILTSGTTGKPKAARHTWRSLARPARRGPQQAHPRWLLTYRPNLYAGLQVVLQCFVNSGALIAPTPRTNATDVVRLAADASAQFSSATPSYWRWLLTFAPREQIARLRLSQVTLGGEVVDQPILDALRNALPQARLVHIYATTELGRCFSVTDGQPGFPARFLEQPSPDGVEMRVEQGELIVRSANAMRGTTRGQTLCSGSTIRGISTPETWCSAPASAMYSWDAELISSMSGETRCFPWRSNASCDPLPAWLRRASTASHRV